MRISSNYGLKLMEGTDNVKRQDFVDNFTKIDAEMRAIENGGYPIVEATGTNAYVGATARIKSLGKGTKLTLFVGTNATGNCSLNLNSYGAKNIKDSNGNIVTNMKANIPYNLCYNGTDFILQGKGGGGNLIPKYLLAGYYGEGDNGRVDGAMVNRGAPTFNLNCGGVVNLQEGYYAGGQIRANSLESQTPSNADASKIISGYHAWINGRDVWGTAVQQIQGGTGMYKMTSIYTEGTASPSRTFNRNIDIIVVQFYYITDPKRNHYHRGSITYRFDYEQNCYYMQKSYFRRANDQYQYHSDPAVCYTYQGDNWWGRSEAGFTQMIRRNTSSNVVTFDIPNTNYKYSGEYTAYFY